MYIICTLLQSKIICLNYYAKSFATLWIEGLRFKVDRISRNLLFSRSVLYTSRWSNFIKDAVGCSAMVNVFALRSQDRGFDSSAGKRKRSLEIP